MTVTGGLEGRMRPIIAALGAGARKKPDREQPVQVAPFITISREAGAHGNSLAGALVKRLNESLKPDQPHWESFDRDLVERVSADHSVSGRLVEALEEGEHNWLRDMLSGLFFYTKVGPTDREVFQGMVKTVLAIAKAGRAVIVGRGGAMITHNMPGGVHVRLIAPIEERVAHMARRENVSEAQAAQRVRKIDENRQAFYRHFFSCPEPPAHLFTVTFNAAKFTDEKMAEAIIPLLG